MSYGAAAEYCNCDGCQKPSETKYITRASNNLVYLKLCSKCWHNLYEYLEKKGFKKI
jgi:hypothetical protein